MFLKPLIHDAARLVHELAETGARVCDPRGPPLHGLPWSFAFDPTPCKKTPPRFGGPISAPCAPAREENALAAQFFPLGKSECSERYALTSTFTRPAA
jgi:hypothetical protein